MAKSGFVYAITNDAMPGLVKIGATLVAREVFDTWARAPTFHLMLAARSAT